MIMKGYFTCVKCGKKFLDELPDPVNQAVMFSMCLECGKKYDDLMYRKSN